MFYVFQGVSAGGRLKVYLVNFTNPGGKGSNGECCDGKHGICEAGPGCDHKFTVCVDKYPGLVQLI